MTSEKINYYIRPNKNWTFTGLIVSEITLSSGLIRKPAILCGCHVELNVR